MFRNRQTQTPAAIEKRISQKEKELEELQELSADLEAELQALVKAAMPVDADAIVKKHIRELKEYNELRDTAMSLMTLIADQRQIRLCDVMAEVGVEKEDEEK